MKRVNKLFIIVFLILCLSAVSLSAARVMEALNRGVVAVRTGANSVYVGWRMFGTDPSNIEFNVYRNGAKINGTTITNSTNYVDNTAVDGTYTVRAVISGVEQGDSETVALWNSHIVSIPLNVPAGGTTPDAVSYTYVPNDCSTGDIDGDGEYEIILKWDPTNSKDNSQSGHTGNVYLDAYEINGTFLYRIDLGINIRAGAHYTQFMVYDLDNDGRAEIACKTAPGTRDGTGSFLSTGPAASDNDASDYRSGAGYVLTGPEYLTVFNGATGAEVTTVNYVPARGNVSDWGDNYGNRVDRFLACVAYLDGATPSLVMCRGYYTRAVLAAWDFDGSTLSQRWVFDSNDSGNGGYAGQGNHNLAVGDVDNDGFDEIVYGACAIDNDGTGLYTTGLGHGDAGHLSDMDPDRPGLEYFQPHEDTSAFGNYGAEYRAAGGDTQLWGYASGNDVGRGLAADIDPNYRGYEFWASNTDGVYNVNGTRISTNKPSTNFRIYWDADFQDEILDGNKMDKWNGNGVTRLYTIYNDNAESNNGSKANPGLVADLFGDWREEMIFRHNNNQELLVFTTTIPTTNRFYTLMHDPVYRAAIAWQNVAYNQPPHASFYVADGPSAQPIADIIYPNSSPTPNYSSTFTHTFTQTPTETPTPVGYIELQGEDACAMDGIFENTNIGYTGSGYANLDNATGTSISFYLDSSAYVNINLDIRYANGSATNRSMEVFVNGVSQVANLDFLTTGDWTAWNTQTVNINLVPGYNEIMLTSLTAEGAANLDLFSWVSTQVADALCSVPTETPTKTWTQGLSDTATQTPTKTWTQGPSDTATQTPTKTWTQGPSDTATQTPTETGAEVFLCSAPGFASENGGTTGGGSAAGVTVTTLSALQSEASSSGPKVIILSGTVGSGVADRVLVGSDKTIIGLPGATLIGGFEVKDCSNVIIRNITIQGPGAVDVDGVDCVIVQNATNVWLDHLDVSDGQDGNMDIVNGSNYVTVTWTKFHYTAASVNHQFCNLIGNSDSKTTDRGKLKVTFMDNWWADGVDERMPRLRFGQVHMSNNLFTSPGNNYCARAGLEADLFIENNVFKNVNDPVDLYDGDYTAVTMQGNLFISVTGNTSGDGTAFTPPYALATVVVGDVETFVSSYAGVRSDFEFCPSGATPVNTATKTWTQGPSDTATQTPTETATSSYTPVPTDTATNTPTLVPSTSTYTYTYTPLPTSTYTSTQTHTNTPVPPTASYTDTPTETATNSQLPTASYTDTPVNTPTNTYTTTPISTDTATNIPTATYTWTNIPTSTQTPVPVFVMTVQSVNPTTIDISNMSTDTITVSIDANKSIERVIVTLVTGGGTPVKTLYDSVVSYPVGINQIIFNDVDMSDVVAGTYYFEVRTFNGGTSITDDSATFSVVNNPTPTTTDTPVFTNTQTHTFTETETLVPSTSTYTYTYTPTTTHTPLSTSTYTPTPTQTDGEKLEVAIIMSYPQPLTAKQKLRIQYKLSQRTDSVELKIYSCAFRLIEKFDLGNNLPAGVHTAEISERYFKTISNGTYYYVINAENGKGKAKSKIDKIIILK